MFARAELYELCLLGFGNQAERLQWRLWLHHHVLRHGLYRMHHGSQETWAIKPVGRLCTEVILTIPLYDGERQVAARRVGIQATTGIAVLAKLYFLSDLSAVKVEVDARFHLHVTAEMAEAKQIH